MLYYHKKALTLHQQLMLYTNYYIIQTKMYGN